MASLIDDAARLCVAAGLDLCAVYPSSGSSEAITYQASSAELDEASLSVERKRIFIGGEEHAYVLFGSRNGSMPALLIERALTMIATAIAQSERLAHYHRVSDRLQQSLLPARLPVVAGLHFDAAYSPGSTEAEVGGDWYDAFEIGDGLICISVGDVTGHGLESAVTMAELRRAIRAAAFAHDSPQAALVAVDQIAASQNIGLATAIIGYLDPATSLLRYACAGHPPPILLTARGRAFTLPGGGTLLGLGIGCASSVHSATLTAGTSFVLYTDGLTEVDRDIISGEQRLIASIERLGEERMLEGRALHDLVLGGKPRDDCATLIVRRHPTLSTDRERYTFSAVPSSARLVRDALRDFASRCGTSEEVEFAMLLASGEAIANGIEHGSQEPGTEITVDIAYDGGSLDVDIESRGHWRSSSSEHRGRGIALMRAYATRFALSTSSDRTRVSLAFTPGKLLP